MTQSSRLAHVPLQDSPALLAHQKDLAGNRVD